jgi:hypothetical protein
VVTDDDLDPAIESVERDPHQLEQTLYCCPVLILGGDAPRAGRATSEE